MNTPDKISNTKKETTASTIKYKGNVTVKYVDKNGKTRKVIKHNAGKLSLFNFLCLSLAQENNKSLNYMPSRLIAYNKEMAEEGSSAALTRLTLPISYYSPPQTYYKNDQGEWILGTQGCTKVVYSFLITPQAVINTEKSSSNFLRLVSVNYDPTLENSTNDMNNRFYICAELDLLNVDTTEGGNAETSHIDETIEISNGSNILIYWELMFE